MPIVTNTELRTGWPESLSFGGLFGFFDAIIRRNLRKANSNGHVGCREEKGRVFICSLCGKKQMKKHH